MRRPTKRKNTAQMDAKYSSVLVGRLINQIMLDGKKSVAQSAVYSALEQAEKKIGKPALEVLDKAIENAGPQVELRSRRVGGANYQVPREVTNDRKVTLALRWIVQATRKRKGAPIRTKLAEEIINAVNNEGTAVKKKQDTHRMAEANKAFAHFAW